MNWSLVFSPLVPPTVLAGFAIIAALVLLPGVLRRMRGGMVICRFGGLVVPDEGDLSPLETALECPLFLVR